MTGTQPNQREQIFGYQQDSTHREKKDRDLVNEGIKKIKNERKKIQFLPPLCSAALLVV
jgi:hypothetical protein